MPNQQMKSDYFHLIGMAKNYARKARRNGYSARLKISGSPHGGYGAFVTLVKYLPHDILTWYDPEYKSAVNFTQSLYNDPLTLNYEGTKYILPCGSQDDVTLIQQDDTIFVIGENRRVGYIGLTGINTVNKAVETEVYLSSNDVYGEENKGCPSYHIIEKPLWKKFQSLLEYTYLD